MTPLSERSRGHRFGATAAWYLLGAVAGGATVGIVLALAAAGVDLAGPSTSVAAGAVAVAAFVAGAADLRIGPSLPIHRRQVDEDWFNRYRRWLYASGFGWQIGNGVVTFTTTACLYAAAVAAVATGDPVIALALGVTFGGVRGLAVFLGLPLTKIDAVRRLHQRLDRWAEPSRIATGMCQVAVAIAIGAVAHPALAVGIVVATFGAGSRRRIVGTVAAGSDRLPARPALADNR